MIFLDNNSTTPVDSRVQKVIADSVGQNFGNPHSLFHKTGINASSALSKARKNIAEFFGVENEYVVFNSGATEANNQFIIGSALKALSEESDRKKIFCSSVEHKCVLNAADYLQSLGFEKYEIPVDKKGQVSLEYLKQNLDENTLLVSVMAVNNETGFSSPLKEVGQLAKERGILFHSDFAQGLMRSWESIADMHLDAISISGHKICGPKGIGALVFTTSPTDLVEPIIHGGLQEGDIRSGTVPVFLVSALSECLTILRQEGDEHQIKIKKIKDIFFDNLKKNVPRLS